MTYTNELDDEYGCLDLKVIVTEPEILESHEMQTSVRKQVELNLSLSNPLDVKQTLTCDPAHPQITTNSPLVLPPKQTVNVYFEY